MVMTNTGKSGLTLMLVGSGTIPTVIAIGSGSGVPLITNTNLVAEVLSAAFTTPPDISVAQSVSYIADFNSVQMSGIVLQEFGIKKSGLANTVWNREGVIPVTFDGTNELQIQITFNVF